MLKELTNGNYFIYQIIDGGCGIVKAENEEHAINTVRNAYRMHNSGDYGMEDITCRKIETGVFNNAPNVIELGWILEA